MTTETKVEAVARLEITAHGRGEWSAHESAEGMFVLYAQHQSALDALRGEVADRKARHERTERDACMWASRAESAEKRADAADRRAAELEAAMRDVLSEHANDNHRPNAFYIAANAIAKESP